MKELLQNRKPSEVNEMTYFLSLKLECHWLRVAVMLRGFVYEPCNNQWHFCF